MCIADLVGSYGYELGGKKATARFVSIEGVEFSIMAVRWEHKTALGSARDRTEQLLRSMPRENLAALHAGQNEGSLHTRAFGEALGLCEQAAQRFGLGRPDAECLLWLETGERARK
jgi:hypothetical protein